MEQRRFGRTEHMSTVAIFGAAALGQVNETDARQALEWILEAGVNHIDIAPSYGKAEDLLGPILPPVRDRFFLGCKTMERTRAGAADELRASLRRLGTDRFDLYQIHAVTSMEELDQTTGKGGALEAILEAREQGLVRHIGITGHGALAPKIFLEALNRFDFDTVLFPLNYTQYAIPDYRQNSQNLLAVCRKRDVGVMAIKSITRAPWGTREQTHHTWYEPFTEPEKIQAAINFTLSQDVTGICTAGDLRVLPDVLKACRQFRPLTAEEQEEMVASGKNMEPLFI